MSDVINIFNLNEIQNYYGSLTVKECSDGKFHWMIEDWNGVMWFEIPEYLYKSLLKYSEEGLWVLSKT